VTSPAAVRFDIGVHTIDLALYFLGFPPVREVIGTTRSDFGP